MALTSGFVSFATMTPLDRGSVLVFGWRIARTVVFAAAMQAERNVLRERKIAMRRGASVGKSGATGE